MSKKLFCVLLFTIPLMMNGQVNRISVDWGAEFKSKRGNTLSDIFGYDESGMYAVKGNRGSSKGLINLEKFDPDLNLILSEKIKLEEQGKLKSFEFIIQLKDQLFLFTSFKNQKQKKNYLFVQTLNKSTLIPSGASKKIAEVDYSGYSRFNTGGYGYSMARDSSKLLIFYNKPYDKGANEKYGFHVFDEKMNELYQKEIELPYKEELFDIERYRVDKNGNIYLQGLLFRDKRREKRKGEPNYEYRIITYNNTKGSTKEYPVDFEDMFITDMQIAVNDANDIICAGFYSDKGTFSIKGTYFISIDPETKQIKTKSLKEFTEDFILQNLEQRQAKKAKKKLEKGKDLELYEYDLKDIIIRSDGGAILTGEQFYIRVVENVYTDASGNRQVTRTRHYHYNDIIVINVNPDGQIEWSEKIAKRQHSTNDGGFYSSFAMAVQEDKLHFFFNDNPKNLYENQAGKVYNFIGNKDAIVSTVTLDSDGRQSKQSLFDVREAGVIIRPKVCEQIDENTIIIFGQKGKVQRFAKVKMN
ncbi:MAG: hypothetical protein MRY83_17065 [Flavobacteriales bacterium]|nr:hypothetical protein [Flavobacteriales bacterium]